MMKVLHLRSSGGFLGAERVVIELSQHLPSLGYEPIVGIPLETGGEIPELYYRSKDLGIHTELFYGRHAYDLGVIGEIRRFVLNNDIKIIHSHGYREDLYALGSRKHSALIATNHLWKRTDWKLKLYASLDGYLLRRFQAVVAVSKPILSDLEAAGLSPKRTFLIPNGIDRSKFNDLEPSAGSIREDFGISEQQVTLITVSSLSKEKGINFALDALGHALNHNSNLHLIVVGEGEEKESLVSQVNELGINSHVTFTGRRQDIPALLQSADIFLLPSLNEGLPIAMLEAMAAKKAIIASDVGDVASALANGSGIVITPQDINGLTTNILKLANDPELRNQYATRALQSVTENYDSMAMTKQYADLYKLILNEYRGSAVA